MFQCYFFHKRTFKGIRGNIKKSSKKSNIKKSNIKTIFLSFEVNFE